MLQKEHAIDFTVEATMEALRTNSQGFYHVSQIDTEKINRVRGSGKIFAGTRRVVSGKRNTQKIAEGGVVCRSNQHSRLSWLQLFFADATLLFFFSTAFSLEVVSTL